MYLVYVWARTNPNVEVSFLFGVKFKAAYFPWVLIGFKLLLGMMPLMDIVGAVIGHVYVYLKDIYPLVSGKRLLETPQFLYDFSLFRVLYIGEPVSCARRKFENGSRMFCRLRINLFSESSLACISEDSFSHYPLIPYYSLYTKWHGEDLMFSRT